MIVWKGGMMMNNEKYPRDPETEAFLDTLENNHIFRDMRNEFDKYSEDYVPETHDSIVFEYASNKYGISFEDANDLYVEFENRLTEFYRGRK